MGSDYRQVSAATMKPYFFFASVAMNEYCLFYNYAARSGAGRIMDGICDRWGNMDTYIGKRRFALFITAHIW